MPNIGSPDHWSQFGLGGLVIFVLFTLIFAGGWFLFTRFSRLEDARQRSDDQRQKFLESCLTDHKAERIEWRDRMDKECSEHSRQLQSLTDKTLKAIDDHTAAFRELHSIIHSKG